MLLANATQEAFERQIVVSVLLFCLVTVTLVPSLVTTHPNATDLDAVYCVIRHRLFVTNASQMCHQYLAKASPVHQQWFTSVSASGQQCVTIV